MVDDKVLATFDYVANLGIVGVLCGNPESKLIEVARRAQRGVELSHHDLAHDDEKRKRKNQDKAHHDAEERHLMTIDERYPESVPTYR